MRELMDWKKCTEEFIKKVEQDNEKISSIKKMCSIRLKVIKGIEINDETASIIAMDYYEVIKELMTALLLKHGLKSSNHECLISFLKNKYESYDYEINIIHRLKNVRNRVSYDGVFVKKEYIDTNKREFEHIINLLTRLIDE